MYVYLLATLDTKGAEIEFVRSRVAAAGLPTRIVDTGCLGEPTAVRQSPRRPTAPRG